MSPTETHWPTCYKTGFGCRGNTWSENGRKCHTMKSNRLQQLQINVVFCSVKSFWLLIDRRLLTQYCVNTCSTMYALACTFPSEMRGLAITWVACYTDLHTEKSVLNSWNVCDLWWRHVLLWRRLRGPCSINFAASCTSWCFMSLLEDVHVQNNLCVVKLYQPIVKQCGMECMWSDVTSFGSPSVELDLRSWWK